MKAHVSNVLLEKIIMERQTSWKVLECIDILHIETNID